MVKKIKREHDKSESKQFIVEQQKKIINLKLGRRKERSDNMEKWTKGWANVGLMVRC